MKGEIENSALCLIKQAISRILSSPIIYLGFWLPKTSIRLPSSTGVPPLNTGLHGVSLHRVYLISLQPYCTSFLLHLSSPFGGRALPAMLHYGVRTFLLANIVSKAIRWPAPCKITAIVNKKPNIIFLTKYNAKGYFYICDWA